MQARSSAWRRPDEGRSEAAPPASPGPTRLFTRNLRLASRSESHRADGACFDTACHRRHVDRVDRHPKPQPKFDRPIGFAPRIARGKARSATAGRFGPNAVSTVRLDTRPLADPFHRSVKRVSQSKTPSRVAAIHGDPFARSVGEYGGQVDHPTRHTCFCAALRSLASAVDRQRSAV